MTDKKAKSKIVVDDPYESEFGVEVAAVILPIANSNQVKSGKLAPAAVEPVEATRVQQQPDAKMTKSTKIFVDDPYEQEYQALALQKASEMDLSDIPEQPVERVQPENGHVDIRQADQGNIVVNAFGEMITQHPGEEPMLTVVLDCANIGWTYGHSAFDIDGVIKAISYLESFNINVVGFLPLGYLRKKTRQRMVTEDYEKLENLARNNRISMVPAGDHDDCYILSYARENNAFIVSNDLFVDHVQGLQDRSIRHSMALWLRANRVSYTFVQQEFVLNPRSILVEIIAELVEKREAAMDTFVAGPSRQAATSMVTADVQLRVSAALDAAISLLRSDGGTGAGASAGGVPSGVLHHLYHARATLRMQQGLETDAVNDLKAAMRLQM